MANYREADLYKKEFSEIVFKLCNIGVKKEHAEIAADCFATADAFGVTTHGISILPSHIERAKRGGYNLSPDFSVIKETCSFAVINGDNAFGPVSAKHCLDYAVKKAKNVGIFTVFGRNNNTFGPAFYYSLKAAEKGCIAVVTSNTPPQMAPFGGNEKMLGTNPFSAVVPVPGGEPLIIDFATSVVAKSKFKEYAQKNMPLPDGWALDKNGNPTTDANEGIEGFVLPMAGFKGYGLSMLIDILSGFLSGSAYLNGVGKFYSSDNKCMNVGFQITVIDPVQVLGEEYNEGIRQYVSLLRESGRADGKSIVLPGDDRINHKNLLIGKKEND